MLIKIKKKEAKKMIDLLNYKAKRSIENMAFAIDHGLDVEEQFRVEARIYLELRDELKRTIK